MGSQQATYLLPYILSLAISAWVVYYAARHNQVQGASAYTWLAIAQALMILGFIVELLSPEIGGKILWDKFQWVATALASISIAYFAVEYTEFKARYPLLLWSLVASVPFLMILGVLTDPLHHLIYPNPSLATGGVFPELQYGFLWPIYTMAIHGYLVVLFSFGLLIWRFARSPRLYRAQVIAIIAGLLLPVISTILAILDLHITPLRDSTPISTAIGNLIITWAIFRYGLFDILPIARDTIIDNMTDLVIVLDRRDRIVDINPVALHAIEQKSHEVIGKFAGDVFAEWPGLLKEFAAPSNKTMRTTLSAYGKTYHHEVKATLLFNKSGAYVGRVFVSRDISLHVELQNNLQKLNDELEQRVRDRTVELEEAYDTTLEGWARALELRDKETEGHSWRVTETTTKLALAVGISHEEFDHIRRGAILHDIGKMAIPDEILRKTGPLSEQERDIVLQHPFIAYQLLERIPFLKRALDIPYCHHEKWDGTGYPRGLKGEEIPIAARIFSVADVWDAIQSDRPYKKGWSREEAVAYMQEQAGKYFDPNIVDGFLRLVKEGGI